MKKITVFFLIAIIAFANSGCKKIRKSEKGVTDIVEADYRVIPLPRIVDVDSSNTDNAFILDENAVIFYSERDHLKNEAEFLQEYLHKITQLDYKISKTDKLYAEGIILSIDSSVCKIPESYKIDVSNDRILVVGADAAGVFYAVQTLRKSVPAKDSYVKVKFPCGTISDYPEFSYRGMLLDVSRHFFSVDSVKIYLDMMAMHNINTFHWHLTDDQGWRIQIDKYPKLTTVGAWRDGTTVGRNTNKYDSVLHGGFYTKKELKEIVDYAAKRHIKVIPEFDLPGHTQALLAAYPEFGCTGGPYKVWQRWGVSDEVVCAGNEEAMRCLEDVLNEIMDIFPSEIIHIGGDECPKTRWKECPKCQNKIRDLKIKGDNKFSAEDYLQSYVMNRMEKVVNARGRKIIGWDEILEGNISKTAMIMSWRGTSGGVQAANANHDVVMTPGDYLYFSQGQSLEPEHEPVFADGYLPVERVYSFNPVPDGLKPEAKKHIIGVQANIWGEYAPYFSHVEYDALPRMAALAEIQWCAPETRNYQDFLDRCYKFINHYELNNYNYATHVFDIQADIKPDYDNRCIVVEMSHYGEGDIFYTLDGSDPKPFGKKYTQPVKISENADFQAILVRKEGVVDGFGYDFKFSKSSMKPITLKHKPHPNYAYKGAQTLIDGLRGNKNYRTGRWIGFWGEPLTATIDLQENTDVSNVSFNALTDINDWIYNPKSFTVSVSKDGKTFTKVASTEYQLAAWDTPNGIETYKLDFQTTKCRYLQVSITGHQLPKQHSGYGHPAWLFVDEIIVE